MRGKVRKKYELRSIFFGVFGAIVTKKSHKQTQHTRFNQKLTKGQEIKA